MLTRLPSSELKIEPTEIPDILLHIFTFCEPLQLCHTLSLVCSTWNNITKHKCLWHKHCTDLWKGKLYIINIAINKRISSPYNAYKISYIDRKRNVISFDELTRIKWNFTMKYRSNHFDENEVILSKFTKDYQLDLPRFGTEFRWKFVNGRFNRWKQYELYDDYCDKHSNDVKHTNYGWIQYIKTNKKQKKKKYIQSTKNKLKQKFIKFDKTKIKNSINSGMKQLRRKLTIKKKSDHNICNDDKKTEEYDKACEEEEEEVEEKSEQDKGNDNESGSDIDDFECIAPNGDTNEGRFIQVNQYPPLFVFRDENWGFILENKWVIFTSY